MRTLKITLTLSLLLVLISACSIIRNEGRIGTVEAFTNAGLQETYDAALAAAKDLELDVRRNNVDAMTGQIEAYTADQKRATITLNKMGEAQTEVKVHIEPVGDKNRSNMIISGIQRNLSK